MKDILKAIGNFFASLFKSAPTTGVAKDPTEVLTDSKEKPNPVPTTDKLVDPDYYKKAKSFLGMTEFIDSFNKYLSKFWPKVGLNYKTIIGTTFAWCGLFVAVMFSETGHEFIRNGAGARNWDTFGTKIEYVQKGIPHASVVRINHNFDCNSSKGNHVAFACGAYKPSDFFVNGKLKPGATITLLGGNQGNSVKFSKYDMREICSVRWPKDGEPIPEVTKTIPCDTKGSSGDGTQ